MLCNLRHPQRPVTVSAVRPLPDGIAAGTLFAFFRDWPGAFASIAAVGLNLSEGSHRGPVAIIGFVLSSGPDLVIGRSRLAFC